LLVNLIESVYRLLWGDLFILPLGGGIGISFMVVLLLAAVLLLVRIHHRRKYDDK
jgi:AGCS family alanine or glycine:cation symporter